MSAQTILPGAYQTNDYLPLLKGKKVAVFANQTSQINSVHLVDTLLHAGITVVKIFGPEHGFRGTADAGEHVQDGRDPKTGLPVISLYGKHKKPSQDDLEDVDVLLFDIQDVGVRFYTFISSLEYCLEACLEQRKMFVLLDRPNPNGFYVDGPVLDPAFKSFVGMQPVPIVYGMTIGEYARMLAGERWLSDLANHQHDSMKHQKQVSRFFRIIPCKNYTHASKYELPVAPSPNLKTMQSIYLYPSTCLFEGTVLSEGRGTSHPFQIFGHPTLPDSLFAFIPRPNAGAKSSKCFNQTCYGWFINGDQETILKKINKRMQLEFLLDAYKLFPGKDSFFLSNQFFQKLSGNDFLRKQIQSNATATSIRESWKPALDRFLLIRKKYLLYKDF